MGIGPLSVSSDRIGVTAMRCADLQRWLALRGAVIDRAGMAGTVCEVYPAASLRSWGFSYKGYKGPTKRAVLAGLARSVTVVCGALQLSDDTISRCSSSDDDLDSLVCSLTARAAAIGFTRAPSNEQVWLARREGWIYVPTHPLTELFLG